MSSNHSKERKTCFELFSNYSENQLLYHPDHKGQILFAFDQVSRSFKVLDVNLDISDAKVCELNLKDVCFTKCDEYANLLELCRSLVTSQGALLDFDPKSVIFEHKANIKKVRELRATITYLGHSHFVCGIQQPKVKLPEVVVSTAVAST